MELADQNVIMRPSTSALDNKQRKRSVLQHNCKHNTSLCIFLLSPHFSFDISHTAHTVSTHKPEGTHVITQIWFVTQATDTSMALWEDLANADNELAMKCHIQTVCDICMQSTWL